MKKKFFAVCTELMAPAAVRAERIAGAEAFRAGHNYLSAGRRVSSTSVGDSGVCSTAAAQAIRVGAKQTATLV
jgi:hypothetical protein